MASSAETNKVVQFAPLSSAIDAAFWHKLTQNKLDVYHLDDKPRNLQAYFVNSDLPGLPCCVNLDWNAFNVEQGHLPSRGFPMVGTLHNTNTVEAFKSADKQRLISNVAQQIWDAITSGRAGENPSLLCQFLLLTFADLKHYHFYYWFAFPALCPDSSVTFTKEPIRLDQRFTVAQITSLQEAYDSLSGNNAGQLFFLVKVSGEETTLAHIKEWDEFYKNQTEVMIGFADPCTLPENPGWPLRNILAYLSYHRGKQITKLDVLCLRDRFRGGLRETGHSLIIGVNLPSYGVENGCPKCVGWERNKHQKLCPRMVDLSATMDPAKLAESSVDLNLKLMRWRLLPSLDLDTVATTRCLLLGAGTLGCNIARCLLGWGVRTITFVDSGWISYSNPVRQSLFEFADCKGRGKRKAEAAAEALKRIFPGVNSSGIVMSIPMPGHAVGSKQEEIESVLQDVQKLEELIDNHDVVFLLMDTRESRWLPTVISASKNKLVINAALGFDTFLVMRHGLKGGEIGASVDKESSKDSGASCCSVDTRSSSIPGANLGCYFCNDVVAPGNSTKDRTLDQQCTVSRPGMSFIASSLAVELLVSVIQHPLRGHAAADTSAKDDHLTADLHSPLGVVPHQIRGFLSRYHIVLPASLAFDRCTACSEKVLEMYRKEGFSFLLNAFNVPKYLEDLTGLTAMLQDSLVTEVWELDSDDEEGDM